MQKLTLDSEPNENVQIDKDNPGVLDAIKLIQENLEEKNTRDNKNELAIDLVEEGAEVSNDVDGLDKVKSKKGYQGFWKLISRIKPLDYWIHGVGQTQEVERVMFAAIEMILKRGGYYQSLLGKGGALSNAVAIGDGFILLTTREKGFPFKFVSIPNNNVYLDHKATGFRSGSKQVKKCVIIIERSIGEFNKLHPKYAKKVGAGRIPRDSSILRDLDDSRLNISLDDERIIEEAHLFDIENDAYVVFAGSGCTVINEQIGDDYPFRYRNPDTECDESYIPVFHKMGFPAFKGFYNHGLFHWLYDLCVYDKRLFNKIANHVDDNADPVQLFSVPMGQAESVFEQLEMAQEARSEGKRPAVAVEIDPNKPNGGQVSVSSLATQTDINAYDRMDQYVDRNFRRFGVSLDEGDFSGNPNELQILAEEESNSMTSKQLMEYNSYELERMLIIILDLIPKLVKPDKIKYAKDADGNFVLNEQGERVVEEVIQGDKTPVLLSTNVFTPKGTVKMPALTLGFIAMELEENIYFPNVNSRTGAITPRMLIAKISKLIGTADPGSKADVSLRGQLAQAYDQDIPAEDFITPYGSEGATQEANGSSPKLDPSVAGGVPPQTGRQDLVAARANKAEQSIF